VPALYELTDLIERYIRLNPNLYLPYILLAEYFIVLVGPRWLSALETKCRLPSRFISIVGNHVELDKSHVDEDLREISRCRISLPAPMNF